MALKAGDRAAFWAMLWIYIAIALGAGALTWVGNSMAAVLSDPWSYGTTGLVMLGAAGFGALQFYKIPHFVFGSRIARIRKATAIKEAERLEVVDALRERQIDWVSGRIIETTTV